MPLARRPANRVRVVAHVDLDCFYVQVEQRRNPDLRGRPTAVIQYNPWKGGACIAVGYEARKCGVKRSMRGDDAKAVCPDINLVQVPVAHGKADLSIYRDAGSEVVAVLSRVGRCERASIDEAYLDITETAENLSLKDLSELVSEEACKSHILGVTEGITVKDWLCRQKASRDDTLLACGAIIIAQVRMAVLAETSFSCSAGIAHNKMLAKLASGMHKPGQQTLVPSSSVESLLATLPITKIGHLGGKLGQTLEVELGVNTVGELLHYSQNRLQDLFGVNTGTWLWNIARGINGDEVKDRTLPKSHSSGKTFPGPQALRTLENVGHWIRELAATLQDRLDEDLTQNNRLAHLLTIHASCHIEGGLVENLKFPSKSCALRYGSEKIADDSRCLFEKSLREFCSYEAAGKREMELSSSWMVTGLSLTASNIIPNPTGVSPITHYFSADSACYQSEAQHSVLEGSATEAGDRSESNKKMHFPGDTTVQNEGTSSKCVMDTSTSPKHELGHLDDQLEDTSSGSAVPSSTKKTANLKEIWQRGRRLGEQRQKASSSWDYKEEEIDQSVLSELPKEIQSELQHRLGLNRNCRPKKCTITEFFKSKAN